MAADGSTSSRLLMLFRPRVNWRPTMAAPPCALVLHLLLGGLLDEGEGLGRLLQVVLQVDHEILHEPQLVAALADILELLLPDLGPDGLLRLHVVLHLLELLGEASDILGHALQLARQWAHAAVDDVLAQVLDEVLQVVDFGHEPVAVGVELLARRCRAYAWPESPSTSGMASLPAATLTVVALLRRVAMEPWISDWKLE